MAALFPGQKLDPKAPPQDPRRASRRPLRRAFRSGAHQAGTAVAVLLVGAILGTGVYYALSEASRVEDSLLLDVVRPMVDVLVPGALPQPAASRVSPISTTRRPGPESTATPTTGSLPTPRPSTHVVEPGDTVSGVARRYGVSVADLVEANRDLVREVDGVVTLRVGDELRIPPAE
jgi:hypothetical protein